GVSTRRYHRSITEGRISRLPANGLRRRAQCWTGTGGLKAVTGVVAPDCRCKRPRLQLFWLLAQQVICVRHQLRYRFRFSRVVVAADLAVPIHQHYPRAVDRNALCAAAVCDGEFKTIVRE